MPVDIVWLGHASVMVRTTDTVLYIDPWKISPASPQADIILLTHEHYDHYSPEDIALIARETTRIVAPMQAQTVTDIIQPGESIGIDDVMVKALPAYNIDKDFHPKANKWVGYLVTMQGKTIYHTGDTDHIPEMKGITADVVLIPVGGTYTMTADDAGTALKDMNADHVIPIHFGDIVGSEKDARRLSEISTSSVHILSPGESFTLE